MMDQFYGVVVSEVLQTKGYSDFVQNTDPTLSGQLSVSFSPAQTLHNSSGVPQTKFCHPSRLHNPLIIAKTCNAGEDEHEQGESNV